MNIRNDLLGEVRRLLERAEAIWGSIQREEGATMLQLARPQLGRTPEPLRRVAEPLVAGSALFVLVVLLGWGAMSVTSFLLAGFLILVLLKVVFGIELDLEPPLSAG